MRAAQIPFSVQAANIPEQLRSNELPCAYVERLALEKATAVRARLRDDTNTLVLAADTTVVVDEHILEKPADGADAARMLRLLRGRSHQVLTGICLFDANGADVRSEATTVTFGPMSEDEIASYVATGEPMDKAGAYAIQGIASRWICLVEGNYPNVVGLPMSLIYRMLRERKFL